MSTVIYCYDCEAEGVFEDGADWTGQAESCGWSVSTRPKVMAMCRACQQRRVEELDLVDQKLAAGRVKVVRECSADLWTLADEELGTSKYDRRITDRHDSSVVATVDVYEVIEAFQVFQPAVAHAVKKLLCAGQRGVKTAVEDVREARAALDRAVEMMEAKP